MLEYWKTCMKINNMEFHFEQLEYLKKYGMEIKNMGRHYKLLEYWLGRYAIPNTNGFFWLVHCLSPPSSHNNNIIMVHYWMHTNQVLF